MRRPIPAAVLVASLAAVASCAAPTRPFDAVRPVVIEPLALGPVEVPAALAQGVVVIPVHVHGRGPFAFALDSGSTTVVLDERTASDLGARVERRAGSIVTEAGRSDGMVSQTTLRDVRIGDARFRRVGALVTDLAPLSRGVGRRLDGIVGTPLLAQNVWTVDSRRGVVRIETGELPEPNGADVFPLGSEDDLPTLEVDVAGHRTAAIVDTGQRMALALGPADTAALRPRLRVVGTSTGHVLDGEVRRDVAFLDGDMIVGPLVLRAPPVLIARATRLGLDAFQGRALSFDLAHRRLRVALE